MAPSTSSTQNSVLMTFPDVQVAGTIVHLTDQAGNSIATVAPPKEFTSVLISSEKLAKGETYTLYGGGQATGVETNGLFSEVEYKDGVKIADFTIKEATTWLNETGVTTGASGRPRGGFNPGAEPERPQGQGMFDNLDEETKQEVQEILKQMREGTISQEEADQQLQALGIAVPEQRKR